MTTNYFLKQDGLNFLRLDQCFKTIFFSLQMTVKTITKTGETHFLIGGFINKKKSFFISITVGETRGSASIVIPQVLFKHSLGIVTVYGSYMHGRLDEINNSKIILKAMPFCSDFKLRRLVQLLFAMPVKEAINFIHISFTSFKCQ